MDDIVRIYRPHRGTLDAWRRYKVIINGLDEFRIADGELLCVPKRVTTILVKAAGC